MANPLLYRKLAEINNKFAERERNYAMSRDAYAAKIASSFRITRADMKELLPEMERMKLIKIQGQRRVRLP